MISRYEFIDEEKATTTPGGSRKYSIVKMCEWAEVSTSGFYEWLGRAQSATAGRRHRLGLFVQKAFDGSDGTYGYRRVHAQLARWGQTCSPELVRALMRALGLVPCQPRPWRHSLTQAGASGDPACRETGRAVILELIREHSSPPSKTLIRTLLVPHPRLTERVQVLAT